MSDQSKLWQGKFGDAYWQRNRVDWRTRLPFWQQVTENLRMKSALEFGCNGGWNLLALRALGYKELTGIEINQSAADEATRNGLWVEHGGAELLDAAVKAYDLVFTAGVLIHIGPKELPEVMAKLAAASKKYVLAIEYEDTTEREIKYRGQSKALWKRPFGRLYAEMGLKIEETGYLDERDGFDNCTYWLMRK